MSLIGDVVASYALIMVSGRAIGPFIPNVVVEEDHRDELIVTDHPVETGATISDHAFKRPVEVEIRCGWSDSTGGFEGYSRTIYDGLQALQQERQPFTVLTGKRLYQNMLMTGLSVTTDGTTEKVLSAVISLREVIIVSTQGGSQTGSQANMSAPQQTAPEADTGTQTLQTTTVSANNAGVLPGGAHSIDP